MDILEVSEAFANVDFIGEVKFVFKCLTLVEVLSGFASLEEHDDKVDSSSQLGDQRNPEDHEVCPDEGVLLENSAEEAKEWRSVSDRWVRNRGTTYPRKPTRATNEKTEAVTIMGTLAT